MIHYKQNDPRIREAKKIMYKNIMIGIMAIIGSILLLIVSTHLNIPAALVGTAMGSIFGSIYLYYHMKALKYINRFQSKGFATGQELDEFRNIVPRFFN